MPECRSAELFSRPAHLDKTAQHKSTLRLSHLICLPSKQMVIILTDFVLLSFNIVLFLLLRARGEEGSFCIGSQRGGGGS